jgi:hypothetical protein
MSIIVLENIYYCAKFIIDLSVFIFDAGKEKQSPIFCACKFFLIHNVRVKDDAECHAQY